MTLHPGVIQNLGAASMDARPLLPLKTTTFKPLAVAYTYSDGWVVVPWGDPVERMVTREPLKGHSRFKTRFDVDAGSFEKALHSQEELSRHSPESLAEAAKLYAAAHALVAGDLLMLNRGLFMLQAARVGVIVDLVRDLPTLNPAGSGG